MKLKSYIAGQWVEGADEGKALFHAVTGAQIATASSTGLDFKEMLNYGREVGGPPLRKMTFHERSHMLKDLALHLTSQKELFYELSKATGATRTDSWIDIEGGIGNLFVMSGKGRRELPDQPHHIDGAPEPLSRGGTFIGHHICVPKQGVAVHINAFNFPCWGMLEKIAVNLLAGVPAVVKPATLTAYLTELMVQEIVKSGVLPEGALQLVCGSAGDMLDHLNSQDVVTFTGSAETGKMLKAHPNLIENSIPFNMEADSLNCCILGPDATPDTEEFNIFIKEVAKEMTVKAGQKCTAIRRTIVPENLTEDVIKALRARLDKTVLGNPDVEGVRMGPLAGKVQVDEVRAKVEELLTCCEIAHGSDPDFHVEGAAREEGAFMPTTLLYCDDPFGNSAPHDIEAFGPVSTVLPYKTIEEAIELAKLGKGSLVGSVVSGDDNFAREVVLGSACMHGRMVVLNKDCAKESTGHGSPMPHLVHGGPGRAGGGEEMGGVRGVFHYMQRTAIQGSPTTLTAITGVFQPGSHPIEATIHPFKKMFDDLQVGETLVTHKRSLTEADIVNFSNVSWDHFYAHTDTTSLEGSIFEKRVAHGYFILSAAAGLFVDPGKGPVLANYGVDEVRFTEPVYAGDTIYVKLTVKEKIKQKRKPDDDVSKGVVKWQVEVINTEEVTVAIGTILTLVQRKD